MEHKFDVKFAKDYGIEESIMINNLYFWIKHNVANGVNKNDGRYWTFNSVKALSELFPYMNEKKIERVLSSLIEKGLVLKGRFSDDKMIRTNWYSFTDKGVDILNEEKYDIKGFSDTYNSHFPKMTNGLDKNGESIYINNNSDCNNSIEDKKQEDKKITKDDLFEECWKAYRRKGVKKPAKAQWQKLTDKEKELVLPHIKAYVSTREVQYQKDFERYLRDRLFKEVVYGNNKIVYDPLKATSKEYMPSGHNVYYDELRCFYYYTGFYMRSNDIMDGYTDEERPDCAKLCLNNARGVIQWNADKKEWVKV